MDVCPHCGRALGESYPPKVPWWRYDRGQTANLGCGTLIVIAIIIAVFSSGNRESVLRLEQEVRVLQEKIDDLGKGIDKLVPPSQRGEPKDRAP